MVGKFLFISVISLCFSVTCSSVCLDKVILFYTSYMTNILNGNSNETLCEMYLTDGLAAKVQRMCSISGIDPIIRSQDVNPDAIKTLGVRIITGDWFMVSYLWDKNDSTTLMEIPLKMENVDGECKIAYITPIENGVQYGDEFLSCYEDIGTCKIDESSGKSFVESFYKVYIASYCSMRKNTSAKLLYLRLSNLSQTALGQFKKVELENLEDGLNGYDLLINNFDFDCMWRKSLTFAQLEHDSYQISYQAGNKVYKINVTIKYQDGRYFIDNVF